MNILTGLKALKDVWITPKDNAPQKAKPGELHYIAPGGKIEIIAELGSGTDERNIKRVLDILLKSESDYYFGENGVTD